MKAKVLKKHVGNTKDAKIVYLTAAGYKALQEEHAELVNNKRHSIASRIQKAREYGDLSENAEYAEAKDEQSFIEGRILELEQILSNVTVIQNTGSNDIVQIGSKVNLHLNGKDVVFTIVGAQEANPLEKKISHESPLGQALIGQKIGSIVEVDAPVGKLNYKIVSIQ
jgi:transcription elongation factor GreA